MTAVRTNPMRHKYIMCISAGFKKDLERATAKAGFGSVADFVRRAIVEKAAKVGIEIDLPK